MEKEFTLRKNENVTMLNAVKSSGEHTKKFYQSKKIKKPERKNTYVH